MPVKLKVIDGGLSETFKPESDAGSNDDILAAFLNNNGPIDFLLSVKPAEMAQDSTLTDVFTLEPSTAFEELTQAMVDVPPAEKVAIVGVDDRRDRDGWVPIF